MQDQETQPKPSRPSLRRDLHDELLETLARFEVLTSRDLSQLLKGNTAHPSITTINKALVSLRTRHGLTNRVYFIPENYRGRGNNPNAWGLSKDGAELAEDKWPYTHPKVFSATHSPHTIQHDLNRARTHIAIADLCNREGWELGWKKGGYHLVRPDDVFEITKTKTAHFFLEVEHKKKDFPALYEKLKPYVELHGQGEMKSGWGFRNYTVIVPMRDVDAMMNVLAHFKGGCNCIDPKMKSLHKRGILSDGPFKLITDVLWFTTHDDVTKNPGGKIFHTTKGNTHSFVDILG
jgi:hypothetical protein